MPWRTPLNTASPVSCDPCNLDRSCSDSVQSKSSYPASLSAHASCRRLHIGRLLLLLLLLLVLLSLLKRTIT